jgi:hypothetical protein
MSARSGKAYAARAGLSVEEFLEPIGSPVTPESAGGAVVGPGGGRCGHRRPRVRRARRRRLPRAKPRSIDRRSVRSRNPRRGPRLTRSGHASSGSSPTDSAPPAVLRRLRLRTADRLSSGPLDIEPGGDEDHS